MKSIKHFLVRYKAWIMAVLAPLGGVWALLLIAFIDASFFGIPIDPVFIYYAVSEPRRILIFAVMASLGSAIGSLVPYCIGYKGGEEFVVKKIGQQRFSRMHALSEKYGDLALIIPALMPPGFPFKACVLMAGVTELDWPHFLLAIFVGRLLRFLIVGGLILAYGPEILSFLLSAFQHHRGATFAAVAAIVAIIALIVRLTQSRGRAATEVSIA